MFIILITYHQGDLHKALGIVYREWRLHFSTVCSDRCSKPVDVLQSWQWRWYSLKILTVSTETRRSISQTLWLVVH